MSPRILGDTILRDTIVSLIVALVVSLIVSLEGHDRDQVPGRWGLGHGHHSV